MTKHKVSIVFENDAFVVVNKPAGLLSIPDREQSEPSLKDLLAERYGQIYTVHRLDRDTSGIILFAKEKTAHQYFSEQFTQKKIQKFYLGLVLGAPAQPSGTIDQPILEHPAIKGKMLIGRKGKSSVTDYEMLEQLGRYSLLRFQLHTGRTHQIRIHCQYMGCPIVCDPLYGDGKPVLISSLKKKYHLSKNELEEKPILNRTALHAHQLFLQDAIGQSFNFIAEPPKDMRALLQQLRKLTI